MVNDECTTIGISKTENIKVMIVQNQATVPEVLEIVECALRGCGFCFDGHLEVVDEEE